jgi:Tol biopolymer transport system component/DNA-binding winged helix-turn-helix (wHTH) protein
LDSVAGAPDEVYQAGDLCIDAGRRLVTRNGLRVPLPNLSFDLLLALARAHPRMLTTEELLDSVWAPAVVNPETVGQRAKLLRQALGDDPHMPQYVVGVRGRGYRMDVPVGRRERDPQALSTHASTASPITAGAWRPRLGRAALPIAAAVALGLALTVAANRFLSSGPNLVTLPAEYEALTDVTDSTTAPVLSPDGRMLAFIRDGEPFLSSGQIWLKVLPAGEPVQLTSEHAAVFAPTFTPDGTRVAYSVAGQTSNGGSWDTWTVPVTGGEPTLLLPNASSLSYIGPHEVMYSEFQTGIHLGIVTSLDDRSQHREIYLPDHVRGMAHYSYLSPDRKSVLVAEMSGTGEFERCRLVSFEGRPATGTPIGPSGSCRFAAWSKDGRWMYFAVKVDGRSHLWRQRYPDGAPEQITFGPTDEETVSPGPDGRSLLTSIGLAQSTLWIHDKSGERRLTTESYASSPRLSADGRRVYFLTARSSSDPPELWRVDIASGRKEPLVTGFAIRDYAISQDEQRVAFTAKRSAGPEIWLAPLDRKAAPKLLLRGGDQVAFDRADRVYFRSLGERANYLHRMTADGRANERILNSPIINLNDVMLRGDWVSVDLPLENGLGACWLMPIGGGEPWLVGKGWSPARWSRDGEFLYVEGGASSSAQTVAVPVGADGLPTAPVSEALQGGISIPHAWPSFSMGPDPSVYVFVESERRRNIYRIPLH